MKSESEAVEAEAVSEPRTPRRSYSDEQRVKVVTECRRRGASISAVALRHGINANVVRKWINRHRDGTLVKPSAMLPVVIGPASTQVAMPRTAQRRFKAVAGDASEVRIEFGDIRIVASGAIGAELLSAAIRAVMGR